MLASWRRWLWEDGTSLLSAQKNEWLSPLHISSSANIPNPIIEQCNLDSHSIMASLEDIAYLDEKFTSTKNGMNEFLCIWWSLCCTLVCTQCLIKAEFNRLQFSNPLIQTVRRFYSTLLAPTGALQIIIWHFPNVYMPPCSSTVARVNNWTVQCTMYVHNMYVHVEHK